MKMFYTILTVGIATVLLIGSGSFTSSINLEIHSNAFINQLIKHQCLAIVLAITATIITIKINSSNPFLGFGEWHTIAKKEKWLGINGNTSWRRNGIQLLLFISLATALFMFMAVYHTNNIKNIPWRFVPFILLFSFTNSLSEELIFRFGVVTGLYNSYPNQLILVISAVLFGLPHYFGNPSGIIGVLMSGTLGYILCKATIETKGIGIALAIHFVQDVIIFTSLMMMSA